MPDPVRTYSYIPTPEELIGRKLPAGVSSCVASVLYMNEIIAEADEAGRPRTPSQEPWVMAQGSFNITGPKGTIPCVLLTSGRPIPGSSPDSGRSYDMIDKHIPELTGLHNGTPADSGPETPVAKTSLRRSAKPRDPDADPVEAAQSAMSGASHAE